MGRPGYKITIPEKNVVKETFQCMVVRIKKL